LIDKDSGTTLYGKQLRQLADKRFDEIEVQREILGKGNVKVRVLNNSPRIFFGLQSPLELTDTGRYRSGDGAIIIPHVVEWDPNMTCPVASLVWHSPLKETNGYVFVG
jgi:hypothetical protein